MDEIKAYLLALDHPLKEATDLQIIEFCDNIKSVLDMLDIMFSILRRNYGQVTPDDVAKYSKASEQAVLLWKKLNMSYTPSFHYVHKEAIRLLQLRGGFVELTEDHLEQSHQTMDKFTKDLATLAFVRNEQWQSRDWQRWQLTHHCWIRYIPSRPKGRESSRPLRKVKLTKQRGRK